MTSVPRELASTSASTSTTPRLTRGQIPATWTQPAEAVSVAPAHAARGLAPTAIVLGGIAACVVLAIALVPRAHPAQPVASATPTPSVAAAAPQPIDQVPEPTPTASSVPTGVAPEDQGGAERPVAAASPASATATTTAPVTTSAPESDVLTELPARKKAKGLVWRAEKMLLDGEVVDAEPLLRRAAALDPTLPDAWRNLGIARATLGDTAGARSAYKRYLKLAPTAPDAAEVRKILAAPVADDAAAAP